MKKGGTAQVKSRHAEARGGTTCPRCGGAGQVERSLQCAQRGKMPVAMTPLQACPLCNGKGRL